MSFSCYLQLDTRRKKKNDLFPIILRITVNRKTTSLRTNIAIYESEWDAKQLKIKGSAKSVNNTQRLNKNLKHYQSTAENVLYGLSESKALTTLSISEIKQTIENALTGDTSILTLSSLIDEHITKLNQEQRFGNARTFFELKQFLIKYRGTADIVATSINYNWLSKLETDYKSKGNSSNGLGVRLRALRALINHNRKSGILPPDFNPFENYTIKSEKTKKRALCKSDFDKILKTDTTDFTGPMKKARKYFLISYYLLGISYHDMAQLKLSSIREGKISYRRAKTTRLYSIKISKPLQALLDEFIAGKSDDDFILPIAESGLSEFAQAKRIKNSIGRYNKQLKKIAKELGIESQMMSSYVSRHTLATHARDISKIDIPVISQMLGHNDVSTTAIYLASIEDSVMDEAIEKMFDNS